MTYQEAQELAFIRKWETVSCHVGKSCWCRMIKPIDPIFYDENEEYYICGAGELDKDTAEYFIKLHNNTLE